MRVFVRKQQDMTYGDVSVYIYMPLFVKYTDRHTYIQSHSIPYYIKDLRFDLKRPVVFKGLKIRAGYYWVVGTPPFQKLPLNFLEDDKPWNFSKLHAIVKSMNQHLAKAMWALGLSLVRAKLPACAQLQKGRQPRSFQLYGGSPENSGKHPKMDGENHGKPY